MAVEPEPFDGRPFIGITDPEWAKAPDSVKARVLAKELRRVADVVLAPNFQPRTPWGRKEWERIESFLVRT